MQLTWLGFLLSSFWLGVVVGEKGLYSSQEIFSYVSKCSRQFLVGRDERCHNGIGRVFDRRIAYASKCPPTKNAKRRRTLPVSLLTSGCRAPVQIDTEPPSPQIWKILPSESSIIDTGVEHSVPMPSYWFKECGAPWFRPCCTANRRWLFNGRVNMTTLELRHAHTCRAPFSKLRCS